MTIEEKINKLQTELDELKTEAAKKEVSYNWEPKEDEDYWAIDNCGDVAEYSNDGHISDDFRIKTGNCFKTVKEAEQYLEYLTVLQELRVFAREKNKGVKAFSAPGECYYSIVLGVAIDSLEINTAFTINSSNIYFVVRKDAEEALTHFGDRLKILFTYNL